MSVLCSEHHQYDVDLSLNKLIDISSPKNEQLVVWNIEFSPRGGLRRFKTYLNFLNKFGRIHEQT